MALSFLPAMFQNLSSLIQTEVGLVWGVDQEMKKLSSTLSAIEAVLEDAEKKQLHDKAIQDWLRKLKVVAYDVDDILDECATETLRWKTKSKTSSPLKKVSTLLYQFGTVKFRRKIGNRMKEITEELSAVAEERGKFHLRETVVGKRDEFANSQRTTSLLDLKEVYGRDEDKQMIVTVLVEDICDRDEVSVYPIIGMGGIGKTTLAQMVFNDARVKSHFELRIWICVSQDFDVKRVLQSAIESATGTVSKASDLDSLQRQLQGILNGRRYLIVLDDVWNDNEEDWDTLKHVLACGSKGASVIITTRLEKVSSIMSTIPPHHMSFLSEDDCWMLFRQRAFGHGNQERQNLVGIGKEIVKKCGGVPLAAEVLGGLLRFKSEESEWILVKESEVWNLPHRAEIPSCLLYFPGLNKQDLSTPDPKSRGETDLGRLERQVHQYSDATVSMSGGDSTSAGTAPGGGVLEELNYFPLGMEGPPTISHHFSILRELDLSYREINSLPRSISRLVSLQKLFLRSCALLMMELPPEIGELANLEVLDLEGTEILCLPKEIAKLVNLTCLKVSFYGYANQTVIPRRVLSNLSRLNELIIDVTPYGEWWDVEVEAIIDDLWSLEELRTLKLYFPTAELLEELTLIFPVQGLANFRFTVGRYEEHFISRLPRDVEEEFNNREKLEKGLKYVNGDRIPNEINEVFKHVNAFYLQRHWTAESLSEFGHENLNELKFCLVMECNEFQTIIDSEKLYQEKYGRAESEDFQDFDEAMVLGSLERLIIRYMKNMESIWKGPVGKESLSNLKSLALHTCPNLTTLFTIDVLNNLINLEELLVQDCPKINSLVSLKNSGSKSVLFLPSLKEISLLHLPGLVSISSGLWIALKLERMVIFYCPKLEKLSATEVSSTELKVIKGEKEWWDALKWYESDLSMEHEYYLARLFIPLRRDGDLMAQFTED